MNEILENVIDLDLGDLNEIKINMDGYKDTFDDLLAVEGFRDYLRETLALDVKRYFMANPAQQEMIKGAYHRTKYLLTLLEKIAADKMKVVDK